jgi:hypothetical protein
MNGLPFVSVESEMAGIGLGAVAAARRHELVIAPRAAASELALACGSVR